jgi:hypothetical protein
MSCLKVARIDQIIRADLMSVQLIIKPDRFKWKCYTSFVGK